MMKRVVLLSAAACAGAASLRGDGVEEVGEQIEHFPPPEYYVHVDRRLLVDGDGDGDAEARAMMEDYFDEWPDQEVVGHVVEDEDEIYVDAYARGEGEEDAFEDLLPQEGLAEWSDADVIDEYPGEDIVGTVVEDEGSSPGAEDAFKEYAPDPNTVAFEGTSLTGEAVDQYDRREATCASGRRNLVMFFSTDNYAYETSWQLLDTNSNAVIDSGPPAGTNYVDKTVYIGQWCLSPGNYKVKMMDSGKDGICRTPTSTFGCGSVRMTLEGDTVHNYKQGVAGWNDWWSAKNFAFIVGIGSRIDGVGRPGGDGNSGQWCRKVRSKMRVPRGTCTTAGGQQGHRVRVSTTVDKYGKETSWQITKSNVVKMKMAAIVEKNGSKSVEQCLPAGKYTLDFRDLDGICCRHGQGEFKLLVNGKELLNGGSFVGSIQHVFQLGFDWLATMGERDCEWWWAHDYRRRDWHTRCYKGQYCDKPYRHLKWSPALAVDAKDYARRLLATCDTTGILHDKTDQGENLAKNKGNGAWGDLYPADKVTKRFVDNEEFWGWNRNAHLTQAMWYPSRYMGCGESLKDMGKGKMCRMQVCRFAKAGNCMMGKYKSDEGNNWMTPMMMDDSPCGPMCASRDGCYH